MARFVSRYGAYSHGVREEIGEHFAKGTRIVQRGLEAQFGAHGLTDEDVEFALTALQFHGLPEDRDTGLEVSGRSRLSLYDSEHHARQDKLTDEEHDLIVQTLRESERNGLDYAEIVPLPAEIPWNGYDHLTDASMIVELTTATETPASLVLAYELENQNRPEVIAALQEIAGDEADQAVVIDAT